MTIRQTDDGDAAACVALLREVAPYAIANERTWLHRRRTTPERTRLLSLVAEVDGRVVARGEAGVNWFLADAAYGFVNVAVTASRRRRGIGSALYDRLAEHARQIGIERAQTYFHETDDGTRFARGRGFHELRAETPSAVDPRTVDVPLRDDVELVPLARLDPREVHRVDEETTRDVPYVEPIEQMPYDDWLNQVWRNPTFAAEGSFAAVVEGEVASLSILFVDLESGRGMNGFTATRRPYRGRGLALAVKVAVLRWAAANGVTTVFTTNDETNAPMLAVNRRLGYRPQGRNVEYLAQW
jgi:GNAT superfamily N-acetyltransferase